MQQVSITTDVGEMDSIQHYDYLIKCVSDLQQVGRITKIVSSNPDQARWTQYNIMW